MTERKRLEAVGSRGEACFILCGEVARADGWTEAHFLFATGERLRPHEAGGGFETLDGKRRITLNLRADGSSFFGGDMGW